MTGNRRPHDNSRNVTHSNHDRATATPRCVLDQRDATMVKPATREKQSIEIFIILLHEWGMDLL